MTFRKILCLISISFFVLCGFVTTRDEKYVSYFLHLYSAGLFRERNFTLHDAKAIFGKDHIHRIEMSLSCYKALPLENARKLLVSVTLDFLEKINTDPGLKEKGLIKEKFIPRQLHLRILCDNVIGETLDAIYVREIILDRGQVTYITFKNMPEIWGKSSTIHEEFEYSLMLTGNARPPEEAIIEGRIVPQMRAFPGDVSDRPIHAYEELIKPEIPEARPLPTAKALKEEPRPPIVLKSVVVEEIYQLKTTPRQIEQPQIETPAEAPKIEVAPPVVPVAPPPVLPKEVPSVTPPLPQEIPQQLQERLQPAAQEPAKLPPKEEGVTTPPMEKQPEVPQALPPPAAPQPPAEVPVSPQPSPIRLERFKQAEEEGGKLLSQAPMDTKPEVAVQRPQQEPIDLLQIFDSLTQTEAPKVEPAVEKIESQQTAEPVRFMSQEVTPTHAPQYLPQTSIKEALLGQEEISQHFLSPPTGTAVLPIAMEDGESSKDDSTPNPKDEDFESPEYEFGPESSAPQEEQRTSNSIHAIQGNASDAAFQAIEEPLAALEKKEAFITYDGQQNDQHRSIVRHTLSGQQLRQVEEQTGDAFIQQPVPVLTATDAISTEMPQEHSTSDTENEIELVAEADSDDDDDNGASEQPQNLPQEEGFFSRLFGRKQTETAATEETVEVIETQEPIADQCESEKPEEPQQEEPKEQSFFSRLFGSRKAETPAPEAPVEVIAEQEMPQVPLEVGDAIADQCESEKPEEPQQEEPKEQSFFSRLFGGRKAETPAPEATVEVIAEQEKPQEPVEVGDVLADQEEGGEGQEVEPEKQKEEGFFSRIFGSSRPVEQEETEQFTESEILIREDSGGNQEFEETELYFIPRSQAAQEDESEPVSDDGSTQDEGLFFIPQAQANQAQANRDSDALAIAEDQIEQEHMRGLFFVPTTQAAPDDEEMASDSNTTDEIASSSEELNLYFVPKKGQNSPEILIVHEDISTEEALQSEADREDQRFSDPVLTSLFNQPLTWMETRPSSQNSGSWVADTDEENEQIQEIALEEDESSQVDQENPGFFERWFPGLFSKPKESSPVEESENTIESEEVTQTPQ